MTKITENLRLTLGVTSTIAESRFGVIFKQMEYLPHRWLSLRNKQTSVVRETCTLREWWANGLEDVHNC